MKKPTEEIAKEALVQTLAAYVKSHKIGPEKLKEKFLTEILENYCRQAALRMISLLYESGYDETVFYQGCFTQDFPIKKSIGWKNHVFCVVNSGDEIQAFAPLTGTGERHPWQPFRANSPAEISELIKDEIGGLWTDFEMEKMILPWWFSAKRRWAAKVKKRGVYNSEGELIEDNSWILVRQSLPPLDPEIRTQILEVIGLEE